MLATSLGKPATRILNAADPEALTVAQIGELIARHMSYEGEILPLDVGDDRYNAPAGWSPWSVPTPFILETRAASAIGWSPVTDYAGALPATVDWLASQPSVGWEERFPALAAYPRNLFDYAAEDSFLTRRP